MRGKGTRFNSTFRPSKFKLLAHIKSIAHTLCCRTCCRTKSTQYLQVSKVEGTKSGRVVIRKTGVKFGLNRVVGLYTALSEENYKQLAWHSW